MVMLDETQYPGKGDSAWLEGKLPALYGPHSDRPWAQVLQALAHRDIKV